MPLSEQFKRVLPRTLFWRALLIVVTPLLLVQIIGTLIYYDRHVEAITRRLALGVGGDINMVMAELDNKQTQEESEELLLRAQRHLGLIVDYLPGESLESLRTPARFPSLIRRKLYLTFNEVLQQPFILDIESDPNWTSLAVNYGEGVLRFQFWHKRVSTSTTYLFVIWSWGLSLILVAISIVFLRNQIRPIRRLSEAAEAFGRGKELEEDFKPSGAREVRQAGLAFMDMRNRIDRHIRQRTDMLSGVSHDLRTPLTRMKLQLAMMADQEFASYLNDDITEMETMINGYLDFARGEGSELTQDVDLWDLTADVVHAFQRSGFEVGLVPRKEHVSVSLRPNAAKRALSNVLENARRYASQASVRIKKGMRDSWVVEIDDDGPGIPEEKRSEVFRPFKRLEDSRNSETGGAGLGLTIVRDVVQSLGGEVRLGQSSLGGLRVELIFPK